MKKYYLAFTLLLLYLAGSGITSTAKAQGCTNTSLYPSTVQSILHDGTSKTISSAQYAKEYSIDSLVGAVSGDQYRFTSSVTTDFLTLRDSVGNYLASGVTPLVYTIPATILRKVQLHVNTNASCGTEEVIRTTTGQLLTPYVYTSSTTTQPSTTTVTQGAVSAQVLRLNIVVGGGAGSLLNLTNLNLGTGTMTNSSLIQTARVYYTGTSTTFSTTTQFGSDVSSPNTSFSITGSQALVSGTNYFFVVYDVPCTAPLGDSLDAEVSSIAIDGNPYTPTITNPAGNRKITALYAPTKTDGNSTTAIPAGTQNVTVAYGVINGSSICPAIATQVNFSIQANNAADITSVRCYYTTTSTFSTAVQFGATVNNPSSGLLTIPGSQALATGTNYFWLVYNINCNAVVNDTLNGDIRSITVGGTAYTVTGTAPAANAVSSVVYSTVTNGNWNNPAIWSCGAVPTNTTNVSIGNTITMSNTGNVAANVTITSSGSLTLTTGGTLTLGNTGGGNQTFTNNGTLNVSGGTLNVNGSVVIANGSVFNQSGGDIIVDGNDGTIAGSAAGDIFSIGISGTPYASTGVSLTGGRILIVDPSASTSTSVYAFVTYLSANTYNITASTNHTLQIGDGSSTTAGGSANGFYVYFWPGTGALKTGNYVIDAGTGTNRFVTQVYRAIVGGNLTVNSGELRFTATGYNVAGNILVASGATLTASAVVAMSDGAYTSSTTITAAVATQPQTIGGAGTFRNATTSPTAGFASLTINNTNTAGVTLNIPLTLSGTLTLTAGKINTTSTNLLTLGYNATNIGTLSYATNSWVNGPFKRWISAAAASRAFPVGNADSVQLAVVNYTTTPTTAGSLTARWVAGDPGFPNASPLAEGSLIVNKAALTGSWFIDAADGLAGGSYTGSFTAKGLSNVIDYTKLVLLKRPSAGGDWTLDGTHVTTTGSNSTAILSRTGMIGFSQFAIGGGTDALPIKFEYLKGNKAGSTNALNWKVTCNTTSITMVLERSADARTFSHTVTNISATQARCGQPFNAVDAMPLNGISYYRLKMIDVDGNISYSPVAAVLNGKAGAELVGIYPTVIKDQAYLSVTSSRNTTMQFSISDMSGKVIKTINQAVSSGSSMLPVNTSSLASGVYNITGILDGVRTQTLRFVKQ